MVKVSRSSTSCGAHDVVDLKRRRLTALNLLLDRHNLCACHQTAWAQGRPARLALNASRHSQQRRNGSREYTVSSEGAFSENVLVSEKLFACEKARFHEQE